MLKSHRQLPLIITLTFVGFISTTLAAQAATLTVSKTTDTADNVCNGDCSLREAIYVANSNSTDDTIILGTGTYTLSIINAVAGVDEDSNTTGDLDINESGHTLEIRGNGFNNTIIDANGLGDRVFELITNTTLDQVAIKNGSLTSSTNSIVGGGILISSGTHTLSNCLVSGNSLTSTPSSGTLSTYGGGIAIEDGVNVIIDHCSIKSNSATLAATGSGNGVVYGGGIYVVGTTILTLNATTINSNVVEHNASGSSTGGGLYVGSAANVVGRNLTISGNSTSLNNNNKQGGGIFVMNSASVKLAFVTIANNSSYEGGGIFVLGTQGATLEIKNSIVSSNSATTGKNCFTRNGGIITSGGYNVDYDSTNSASCAFGGTGDTIANPQLSALADNQALYQTAAISSTSAAKDLVPSASCTDYNDAAVTTDERSLVRPEGNKCDAGAYELDQTVPVITITNGASTTVECKATYTDAGATATDNFDSFVTVLTDGAGGVFTDILGNYAVTYTATDGTGNVATPQARTVSVVDTTAPTINMSGVSSIIQEAGTAYTDSGAIATDVCDSSVSVTTTNPVNTAVLGTYTVTYAASDDSLNSATTKTRTVTVSDTTKPAIALIGEGTITVNQGDTYTDAGATATDSFEGNVTSRIVTTNPVDAVTPGTYTITYNVSDTSGNAAISVTRTVIVVASANEDNTTEEVPIGSTGAVVTTSTNGKVLNLLVNGVQVDQLKIGKKKLASKYYKLKTVSFFTGYHNVIVLTAGKHSAKLTVVRVNTDNQFKNAVSKTFSITNRQALKLKTKLSKKRITASVGKNPSKKTIWQLTTKGKLKPQHN